MPVKAGASGELAVSAAAALEANPAVVASRPPAAPYSLVSPLSYSSPATIPSSVVIAAARARSPAPAPKGAKRKAAARSDAAPDGASTADGRSVRRRASKRGPAADSEAPKRGAAPFKQVPTAGLPHLPSVAVAQEDDVAALFQRRHADKKRTAGGKGGGDGRAALRALPPAQAPSGAQGAKGGARPGRRSRRSTTPATELSSEAVGGGAGTTAAAAAAAPPSAARQWHPGMHAGHGMTLLDPVAGSSAPPPPPVLRGSPPRYASPSPLSAADVPAFDEEDPVRASLQYLRYLAQTVGRLAAFPPRLQQGFNAEQRLYRERLARAMLARDGRHTEKPRPGGTRRSARARFAPEVFVPAGAGAGDGRGGVYGRAGRPGRGDGGDGGAGMDAEGEGVAIQPFDPAQLTDVRMGDAFQAALPEPRPKPPAAPPAEAAWLGGLFLEAGAAPAPPPAARPQRDPGWGRACGDGAHAAALAAATAAVAASLPPPAAAALGLGTTGVAMAGELTPEQQDRLYNGMKAHGRNFWAIAAEFVPGVAPRRLGAFYYDVWKLEGCPAAARWFADKAAAAAARAAAAAAAEAVRAEEAARRAERQEASNRRRQVKEAALWVKGSARGPAEVNYNKPIVRDRVLRLREVMRRIACGELPAP